MVMASMHAIFAPINRRILFHYSPMHMDPWAPVSSVAGCTFSVEWWHLCIVRNSQFPSKLVGCQMLRLWPMILALFSSGLDISWGALVLPNIYLIRVIMAGRWADFFLQRVMHGRASSVQPGPVPATMSHETQTQRLSHHRGGTGTGLCFLWHRWPHS